MNLVEFKESDIEGGILNLELNSEEDSLIAICAITESIVFGRDFSVEEVDVQEQRMKCLDNLLEVIDLS